MRNQANFGAGVAGSGLLLQNTIVAENGMVREFDRHGNEISRKEITWAVEVNRY